MPTVKRRRRSQRRRFTGEQQQELWWGCVLLPGDGPGFNSEAEARAAWREHRAEIMHNWDKPGQRPFGYYRYDYELGVQETPSQWWEELEFLESKGLLNRDEELRVEKRRQELDPAQPETLYSAPAIKTADVYLARLWMREHVFISGWHQRRDRPGIAAKYSRLSEGYRAQIEGQS